MMRKFVLTIRILFLLFLPYAGICASLQDSCTVNDFCNTATEITGIESDSVFVCVEGCFVNTTPETQYQFCGMDSFQTVWFRITTDSLAHNLNLKGTTPGVTDANIAVFKLITDCTQLELINQTSDSIPCVNGWSQQFQSWKTSVQPNTTYLIALIASYDVGGDYTLCVSTVSNEVPCLVVGDIEITARSSGMDLEEPLLPGETVSVCMNVDNYQTGQFNGCQWFQGLIPVFGNGWDGSSFDPDGQPLNATINGIPIGQTNNGIYSNSTWDWFTDVDYHHDNPNLQIGDFDGNGFVDMCNTLYDPDCPFTGGVTGGCCGPCWGNPLGTILPGGWFAWSTSP